MTHVMLVVPWGEALGGAEQMLEDLLAEASTAGCAFDVVFFEPGAFVVTANASGATTFVLPAGRLRELHRFVATTRRLARLIRERRPDVVLAWSPKTQLYLGVARLTLRGAPATSWWQHGVPQSHWIDRLATLLPADAVGCSSASSAQAQARLRPRRRTFVVHPGVADPGPAPDRPPRANGPATAGIVGRLQPWKGQDRFLRALRELRDTGTPIEGLVVGGDAYELSPEYAASVRREVVDLGMAEHVTLTGQVDDPIPFIRQMDVLVNASEEEPFGIVLIEAMACGVPVVAVDRGGPREIVKPGRTGILVQSGDPADLADGIRRVVGGDAPARSQMAEASRARYSEHFTAGAMAARFGEQMRQLAGG